MLLWVRKGDGFWLRFSWKGNLRYYGCFTKWEWKVGTPISAQESVLHSTAVKIRVYKLLTSRVHRISVGHCWIFEEGSIINKTHDNQAVFWLSKGCLIIKPPVFYRCIIIKLSLDYGTFPQLSSYCTMSNVLNSYILRTSQKMTKTKYFKLWLHFKLAALKYLLFCSVKITSGSYPHAIRFLPGKYVQTAWTPTPIQTPFPRKSHDTTTQTRALWSQRSQSLTETIFFDFRRPTLDWCCSNSLCSLQILM